MQFFPFSFAFLSTEDIVFCNHKECHSDHKSLYFFHTVHIILLMIEPASLILSGISFLRLIFRRNGTLFKNVSMVLLYDAFYKLHSCAFVIDAHVNGSKQRFKDMTSMTQFALCQASD